MFSKIPKTSISNFALKHLALARDDIPQKDVPKQPKPWEKFDWPQEKEQAMYLEWGVHCSRKQKPDRAENYYHRALDLRKSDANALYHLSKCERQVAKSKMAFESSKKAIMYENHNPRIDQEYCRCLYQMNEFEIAKAKAFEKSAKYAGSNGENFIRLAETIDENVKDCVGQPYSEFILKRQNIFPDMLRAHQKKNAYDPRPLWKILKEQDKCDVVSVLEKEVVKSHPREMARRKLASKVFHQVYLPHSWKDALYQRELEQDDEYLSSVFEESTPVLRKLLATKNEAIKTFMKVLHARSPLYHEYSYKLKNKKLSELMRDKHFNRVQYSTRRCMFNILNTIRDLRKKGNIEKLVEFVEKSMGEYMIIKTKRIAPWKREFLNEVYNTLALAYTDKCVIPPELDPLDINALEKLFHIKPTKETFEPMGFVFGNKATQIDSNAFSHIHEKKRKFLERMEKRLFYAKESIEKAYIYHEMARAHYETGNFGECEFVANKGVREASQTSETTIWAFLCTLLLVKTNVCNARREKCADSLEYAGNLAYCLGSWPLVDFIDQAKHFNTFKMSRHKSTVSELSFLRKSKSRSFDSSERDFDKLSTKLPSMDKSQQQVRISM